MDILKRFDELRNVGVGQPAAITTTAAELARSRGSDYQKARVEIEQALVLRARTPSRNLGAL